MKVKKNDKLQGVTLGEYEPQMWSCVNCYCGMCVRSCPVYVQTKNEALTARGLAQVALGIQKGEFNISDVPEEFVYACTGCRWCEWNCSQNKTLWLAQHGDRKTKVSGSTMTEIMRSIRVEKGEVPKVIKDTLNNIVTVGNPYGRAKYIKDRWVEDLGCTFNGEDTLLYVGSMVPYEDRSTKMAEAFIDILKKANFTFSMIGGDESDSGALPRYMGEEGLFQDLVERNAKRFKKMGIKQLICLSPHDYDTFVSYYGLDGIDIKHYSETLLALIKDKRLELKKRVNKRVTYQDPCYLGRQHDIYDQPREILKSILDLDLVEMDKTREMSTCCGGGGTGLWHDLPGININFTRADDAEEKNVEYVAVACPACLQMLDDAVKSRNYDIIVKDVAEIVMEAA